jgi:hypothetical protein
MMCYWVVYLDGGYALRACPYVPAAYYLGYDRWGACNLLNTRYLSTPFLLGLERNVREVVTSRPNLWGEMWQV